MISISVRSSSIEDIVMFVNYPNTRWSHGDLYGFSFDVLPSPSSPSEDILMHVDSPDMTFVAHIQLKIFHDKILSPEVLASC